MNTPPIVEGTKRNKTACDDKRLKEKNYENGTSKKTLGRLGVIVVLLTVIKRSILPSRIFAI